MSDPEKRTHGKFTLSNEEEKSLKHWQIKKRLADKEKLFIITGEQAHTLPSEHFLARVVEVQKRYVFVAPEIELGKIETNDVWLGTLARKFLQTDRRQRNLLVVGDRVVCKRGRESDEESELPCCSIEGRLERSSQLSRVDPLAKERSHVLAANVTQLVIVSSFKFPVLKWGLIDRFLVLAEDQQLAARIIINKKDLLGSAPKRIQRELEQRCDIYRALGYPVHFIQANATEIAGVEEWFKDHISVVAGHSGVGKSSIVNHLDPEIVQEVETERLVKKGRHTTTFASFLRLGTGGFVIDTPGIRSFALGYLDASRLGWCFRELREHLGSCKFRGCTHMSEPNCAVRKALEEQKISQERYDSYLALFEQNARAIPLL